MVAELIESGQYKHVKCRCKERWKERHKVREREMKKGNREKRDKEMAMTQ